MKLLQLFIFLVLFPVFGCIQANKIEPLGNCNGSVYTDTILALEPQSIPGKIELEFYDLGGDSISYFDTDKNNNGSGSLNKGKGYLMNFRIHESPDISFTKFHDSIDNSKYNFVQPLENQLYLGWTEPGEWTNYSVDVKETGRYKIGAMYTSNRGGAVQIVINGIDSSGLLVIQSTFHPDEPLAWRQWHHWNYIDSLTTMQMEKGKCVIKFVIEKEGNFNFDYLSFTPI